MFRLWGKIILNNKIVLDKTVEISELSYINKKINLYLDEICNDLDIPKPIWMEAHKRDFVKYNKADFTQESFLEEIDFDRFEIEIFEEDN